ncbi:MAG: transposase domain-containing protein, partial [Pseudolabrys sp.]
MQRRAAVILVAKQEDFSASAIWTWLRAATAVHRTDRLAALAPRYVGRTTTADCDPRAWEFLKADYLRPEQPAFDACYRRLVEEAAPAHGWSPIPSEKTLRRRLQREVPHGVRVLKRQGAEAASRTYPHQVRNRKVLHAMEGVNADGHTFDVFVKWPDGSIGRPCLVAVQDVYSGMIVGHRVDRSESWPAVRLAFADAIESYGIPEHCWLDNGRAFASKMITGRMQSRYRFKVRDDEPMGLLTALNTRVHWVTPYHGQAKPIERAFGDLCESIAKHPFCAGAYTGNSPVAKPDNYGARAIPSGEFETFVAQQIARHNMRDGRNTDVARGRSFLAAFRESYEHPRTVVRRATVDQLRSLLLAAEGVTCR